jgi:3-dehydroquinate synthetase
MATAGAGRDSVVIALGGGVTTDLSGFVAATWHRGIPWIALPTSLLAMADAAVGGKTGVDTPAGKNLVGAFHPPVAVLADLSLLATLPPGEVSSGLAEMVKHAIVGDERLLDALVAASGAVRSVRPGVLGPLLLRSVAVKASVVARDPEERDFRQVLNFGHTIGHAIERVSGWAISHGRAVAAGMSVEAGIAVRMDLLTPGERDRIREALRRLGLPAEPPAGLGTDAILAATLADKKTRAGRVRFALPEAVGRMARGPEGFGIPVPIEVAGRELASL